MSLPYPAEDPMGPLLTPQFGLVLSSRSTPYDGRRVIALGWLVRRTVTLPGNAARSVGVAGTDVADAVGAVTELVGGTAGGVGPAAVQGGGSGSLRPLRPMTSASPARTSTAAAATRTRFRRIAPSAESDIPGSFGRGAGRSSNSAASSEAVVALAALAHRSAYSFTCSRPAFRCSWSACWAAARSASPMRV